MARFRSNGVVVSIVSRGFRGQPDDLRSAHLPGVSYYLRKYKGLVLDKATRVTTSSFTSSTPDHASVIGNTVQVIPSQTTTTRTSVQNDTLRIRTPELRESTWTFTGRSGDQVFPGSKCQLCSRFVPSDAPYPPRVCRSCCDLP